MKNLIRINIFGNNDPSKQHEWINDEMKKICKDFPEDLAPPFSTNGIDACVLRASRPVGGWNRFLIELASKNVILSKV